MQIDLKIDSDSLKMKIDGDAEGLKFLAGLVEAMQMVGVKRAMTILGEELLKRGGEKVNTESAAPEEDKPLLTGLFCANPVTPEGKYLVKRRDDTVVEWPSFVLVARDPIAAVALRAYADEAQRMVDHLIPGYEKITPEWIAALRRFADEWDIYRAQHGHGDPGAGRHRKDDPATVAEMRKGKSA